MRKVKLFYYFLSHHVLPAKSALQLDHSSIEGDILEDLEPTEVCVDGKDDVIQLIPPAGSGLLNWNIIFRELYNNC